jgi:hypothetical protein
LYGASTSVPVHCRVLLTVSVRNRRSKCSERRDNTRKISEGQVSVIIHSLSSSRGCWLLVKI